MDESHVKVKMGWTQTDYLYRQINDFRTHHEELKKMKMLEGYSTPTSKILEPHDEANHGKLKRLEDRYLAPNP